MATRNVCFCAVWMTSLNITAKYIKNSNKVFIIFALICSLVDILKLEAVVSQKVEYFDFSFYNLLLI